MPEENQEIRDESLRKAHDTQLRDLPLSPPPFTSDEDLEGMKKSVTSTEIEAFDEKIDRALDRAAKSMKQVRTIAERVQKAKDKILENDLLNDISKRTNLFRYASSKEDKVSNIISGAYVELDKVISEIDKNINRPPEATEFESQWGDETREYLANMESFKERKAFVNRMVTEGRFEVVDTILRGPNFLTNMTPNEKQQIMDLYKEERHGRELRAIKQLKQVAAQVQHTGREYRKNVKRLKSPVIEEALKSHQDAMESVEGMDIKIYNKTA